MRTVTFDDASHASLLDSLLAERSRCKDAGRLAQLVDWTNALSAAVTIVDDAAIAPATTSGPVNQIDPDASAMARSRFAAMTDDEKVATFKAMTEARLLLDRNAPYGLGTWPINPDDMLPAGVRVAVIDANAAYIHMHEDHAIGRFTTTQGMTVGTFCSIIEAAQALSSIANGLGAGTHLAGRLADEARRLVIRHDVETGMATLYPRIEGVNPMTLNIDIQGGSDTMLVQLVDE